MKRTAEAAGATNDVEAKRQINDMQIFRIPKMPGSWPADDDDFDFVVTYTSRASAEPTSKPKSSIKSWIKEQFTRWFTFAPRDRVIRTPVSPKQKAEKAAQKAQKAQKVDKKSFGNFFELPQTLASTSQTVTSTPTRVIRTQKASKRWSPYHYEHGVARPRSSILRSSKEDFEPFEASLESPKPRKPSTDEDGDVDMDAPLPRRARVVQEMYSSLPLPYVERIDPVHGPPKYFFKHLGINESYGPAFEGWRSPEPHFDPDKSFMLESPMPLSEIRTWNQQDITPSKDYLDGVKTGFVKLQLKAERWHDSYTDKQMNEKLAGMSPGMKTRHEKLEQERQEKENARVAERRKLKKELEQHEKLKKEEEFRQFRKRAAAEAELHRELADQKLREEAEKAREEKREKAERKEATIYENTWRLISREWDTSNDVLQSLLTKMNSGTDPKEVMIDTPPLTRHDLGSLFPSGRDDSTSAWLNDAVVMNMLNYTVKFANKKLGHDTMQKEKPAPYHVFDSNWYNAVKDGSGIARWAAKRGVNLSGQKLRQARKILFPVCTGSHWTVTIVDPQRGSIESMNSLDTNINSRYNNEIIRRIMLWLRFELGDDFMPIEWQIVSPMTQHQNNASDCGVFTIMNSLARIVGASSYSLRQQIVPEKMSAYRHWIAGVLANGGFTTSDGPYHLEMRERLFDGPFVEDPDYVPGLLRY